VLGVIRLGHVGLDALPGDGDIGAASKVPVSGYEQLQAIVVGPEVPIAGPPGSRIEFLEGRSGFLEAIQREVGQPGQVIAPARPPGIDTHRGVEKAAAVRRSAGEDQR
jgi:hypothetical protein